MRKNKKWLMIIIRHFLVFVFFTLNLWSKRLDGFEVPICRRHCNQSEFSIEACSCYKNCHYFGDCCGERHQPELFPWPGTCVRLRFGETKSETIKMITNCYKNGDPHLSQLCGNVTTDNLVSLIPIYDMTQDLSFGNIYCALCHKINISNILVWPFKIETKCAKQELRKVEMLLMKNLAREELISILAKESRLIDPSEFLMQFVNSSNEQIIEEIFRHGNYWRRELSIEQEKLLLNATITRNIIKEGKCELSFPFEKVEKCDERKIINTCSHENSNKTLQFLCEMGAQSIATLGRSYYRNEWCAICNNKFNIDIFSCRTFGSISRKHSTYISLSSLLDFTDIISDLVKPFHHNIDLLMNNSQTNESVKFFNDTSITSIVPFIASFTSISVSITAVVIFGIFLVMNSELRKRNSITVFILAVYIFLNNMTYIFITLQDKLVYSRWICVTIAVANHLFNMNAFMWSLFIAIDICKMLYKSISANITNLSLKRMFTMSFCLSALITGSALSADLAAPEWTFSPRFGADTCWINSVQGHILFYFVPAFLVILANLIAFGVSGYLVVKAARERTYLCCSGQPMTSYKIIIKIALITGLPNIVAFTLVLVPNDSLWKEILNITYSVIYGLQGMFLTVSFIWSRVVKKRRNSLTSKSK